METYLVPEHTPITAAGEGNAVELAAGEPRHLLLTMVVEKIVEQESLDLSVLGSEDGSTWIPKPLGAFPQVFYPGEKNLLLDLSAKPGIRYLRAKWLPNRWGVGPEQPYFEIQVRLRSVPADLIAERKGQPGVTAAAR
jgi:hypothetical protein